ncbi:phosphotransferase family protein, partial [Actinosynnema sp.]|uniref:phosphotransferase family protein n=1 Tax=Actinosynnema sp. TaxID=1872144 RepID=UPI003F82D394
GPSLWQAGTGAAVAAGADPAPAVRKVLLEATGDLVPSLGRLHRATRDLVGAADRSGALADPAPPWGLRLLDGDAPPELWASPPIARLLRRWALPGEAPGGAEGDGERVAAVRALQEARRRWQPMCLVHGDLTHANVVLRPGAGPVLLDWEMARVGDPAWDLAALLAPLLVVAPQERAWTSEEVATAAAVVRAHAAASRLPAPALARRTVLYVGVWLLVTAVQVRSQAAADVPADQLDGDDAAALAGRARSVLADCDRATDRLLEALDAASTGRS